MRRTTRRALGAVGATLGLAFGFVGVLATSASAHVDANTDPFGSGSTKVDIGAGNNGTDIGDAWFHRADDGDGTETLSIHFHLPDGWSESQLCLDDAAFTDRVPPGQCQFSQGAGDDEGDFEIDLENVEEIDDSETLIDFTGQQVCAQLHFADTTIPGDGGGGGQTAYAGHQDTGPSFYGNVCLSAPTDPPPPTPSVSIAKTPDGGTVQTGGTLSFTITVTATGGTANDVDIQDDLPEGYSWTDDSDACDITGGVLTCADVDVAVGQPFSVTVTAPAGTTCGTVNNTATIEGAAQGVTVTDASDDGSITVQGCREIPPPPPPPPPPPLLPSASATVVDCAGVGGTPGILVTLLNGGPGDATFTVFADGLAVGDAETLLVTAAEGSETISLPQAEDVAVPVSIAGPGVLLDTTLTGDCAEPVVQAVATPAAPAAPAPAPAPVSQVAGVQQAAAPAALARTGSSTGPLVLVAGLLLTLGGLSLYGSTLPVAARRPS